MINSLEYNQNQNGLVDFFNPINSHKNMFYHQEQQQATQGHSQHHHLIDQHTQQQQQQHHNIIYQQQQQHLIDYNVPQNCSNQYSSFSYIPQSTNHTGLNQLPTVQNNTNLDQVSYLTPLSAPQVKDPHQSGVDVTGFSHFNGQKQGVSKEDDDDCEDDDDSDDEFDDEDDEFEDDENEQASFPNKKTSAKRLKKAEVDHENDYEIKHNCLTEDGAYMNILFNSPSSLSSSSKSASGGSSFQYANSGSGNVLGSNMSLTNEGVSLKNELKKEIGDEQHDSNRHAQFNSQASYSSVSSTSSLSNFIEPLKMNNQHMNNMISSYSKCGIMNDFDLVNLPLRELNKRLRALPKQMAYNMKKRRRTLKNRKYAQNCRSKRLEQKSEMEIQNHHLKSEISRLGRVIEKFKNEVATLRVAISNKNNSDHQCVQSELTRLAAGRTSPSAFASTSTTKTTEEFTKSFMISAPISNQREDAYKLDKRNCSQLTHLLSLPSQPHYYHHNHQQQHLSQIQF